MSSFFHVTAVLSSSAEQPQGDPAQVLTLHVPLTGDAQPDAAAIAQAGDRATVEVASSSVVLWSSRLWVFDDQWSVRPGGGEEGPLWQLAVRVLRPGEYMTLYLGDGREEGYRVVNVTPG